MSDRTLSGMSARPTWGVALSIAGALAALTIIGCWVRWEILSYRLLQSINRGDTRAAIAALADGADPNNHLWLGAEPPICAAARTENVEITRLLIAKGAYVDAREAEDGGTALHAAIWSERPELTKLLLEAGANPNATYMGGLTPLMRVAETGDDHLAKFNLLIHHHADVHARDDNGHTVLMHVAGSLGDPYRQVRRLLAMGADIQARGRSGTTALICAEGIQNEGCIELLALETKRRPGRSASGRVLISVADHQGRRASEFEAGRQ